MKTFHAISAAGLLAFTTGLVLPMAATAQASTTISACYNKNNGQMRYVASTTDCKNAELPLTWNVAGSQGPQGPQGAKGDKGDKGDPGTAAPKPSNVIIVAKSGGQFSSIQAAMNSITSASATNRYLVWVAPGTYDEAVGVPDYVDLQGAGEGLVTIAPSASSGFVVNTGINVSIRDLSVQSSSRGIALGIGELRNVTCVVNTATDSFPTGIFAGNVDAHHVTVHVTSTQPGFRSVGLLANGDAITLHDVHVDVQTAAQTAMGMQLESPAAVTSSSFSATSTAGQAVGMNVVNGASLNDVTVVATGNTAAVGIDRNSSVSFGPSVTLVRNSNVSAEGAGSTIGVRNTLGIVEVQHSRIVAAGSTVTTGGTMRVAHSVLAGGSASGGGLKCAAVVDENYDFFASSCP